MKNLNRSLRYWILALFACAACTSLAATEANINHGTNDAKNGGVVTKRDPFWPVGYKSDQVQRVQRSVSGTSTVGSWKEAMKQVVINGVSSSTDDDVYAVINGELKSVGDTVSIRLKGAVYTWAVDSIEPAGGVKLRRVMVR